MKVQIGNLIVTVDSVEELDQLVQRYGHATPAQAPPPAAASAFARAAVTPTAAAPTAALSPLEKRLEELREQHGPVYVITPAGPVQSGSRIKHGQPQRDVEVLESAELANRAGEVLAGRWFAKVVEGEIRAG
jgi:hypothetical protein